MDEEAIARDWSVELAPRVQPDLGLQTTSRTRSSRFERLEQGRPLFSVLSSLVGETSPKKETVQGHYWGT